LATRRRWNRRSRPRRQCGGAFAIDASVRKYVTSGPVWYTVGELLRPRPDAPRRRVIRDVVEGVGPVALVDSRVGESEHMPGRLLCVRLNAAKVDRRGSSRRSG